MKNFTNFNLHLPTDVVFGKGAENEAGKMVKKYGGTTVMVVYGGGSIKKMGLYDRVASSLKEAGLKMVDFGGVKPNPRRSHVNEGIKLAQAEKVDFLLGMGGGSSIDTAKAIALALANGGQYWDFYLGKAKPEKIVPVGTIHTISAAGSEMSNSSVLVDDVDGTGMKKGLNVEVQRPCFALMNPELTYTVSAYQTGAGSADIVAHSVMRYFQGGFPVGHLGDEFGEAVMRNVIKWTPVALAHPEDYEARAELMMSGAMSHNDLTGLGRSGIRAGEHPLESQLSGHYDTAHGAGLAMVMPAMLQYYADHGTSEHVARIARFAVKVWGVDADFADPKTVADEGIRRFRAWVKAIGMPLTLKELGVPKEDLDAVVARCLKVNGGKVTGFMVLDENAVRDIFVSVLE